MKIRPVGAESFHADRRTDIKKPIVALRNFGNAPKNEPACIFLLPKLFYITAAINAPVLGIK